MLISLILSWIATICAILTAIKYFVKKNKKANRFFHQIHIPLGIVLIAAGLFHGLLAGNQQGVSLSDASVGAVLFTWNMGTITLILATALGLTYLFRKILKNKWMVCHRILTVLFICALFIHIAQMGISLPAAIKNTIGSENSQTVSNSDFSVSRPFADTDTDEETEQDTEQEVIDENDSEQAVDESESAELTADSSSAGSLVTFSGATLKDGTYEGSASGYKGTITVSVVVSGGAVTNIGVVQESDTPDFFSRAEAIIDTILGKQSLDVDGVSGATYSSKGIRDAVYNALSEAIIDGKLEISEITTSGGHGGKGH